MTAHADLVLENEVGLHARPAALLVKQAATYDSTITITHMDRVADAASLLQVLQLEAGHGSSVHIEAVGDDEDQAVADLVNLLHSLD